MERAIKYAYLSNVRGDFVINFQLTPHELKMTESVKIKTESITGNNKVDLYWTSGNVESFNFDMFIDRTQNSRVGASYSTESQRPKNINIFPSIVETSATIQGLNKLFANPVERDEFVISGYDPSPHFKQVDDENGVLRDLEQLKYFMRPDGMEKQKGIMLTEGGNFKGSFNAPNEDELIFNSPPILRFFYGSIWKEGYLSKLNYTLSVPNRELVPLRLQAKLVMTVHRSGTFTTLPSINEISTPAGNNYITA